MDLESAPSDSSMPSFVQPSGTAETQHFEELWRLCRAMGGGERCTEERWRALGWLPHGDELGSGKRRDKARNARLTQLGKARKKLEQELSTQEQPPEPQEQQLTDEGRADYSLFDLCAHDPECRQKLHDELAKELEELRRERRTFVDASRRERLWTPAADHSSCSTYECAMQRMVPSSSLNPFFYQHGVQPCPKRNSQPLLYAPVDEFELGLSRFDSMDLPHDLIQEELQERTIYLDDLAAAFGRCRPTLGVCKDRCLWEVCHELFRLAQMLAELHMRDVLLPNCQPILQPEARYELKYVAAALALRCGLFCDAQGCPSRPAAAAAMNSMVCDQPLSKNASERVKSWLNKLQHLEQAFLDASADNLLSDVAAATRFLEDGRVTESSLDGSTHPRARLIHSQYVRYSQIVWRSRVKRTPVYDLMERRIAGGPYDWGDTDSVALPAYLLDRQKIPLTGTTNHDSRTRDMECT